MRKDSLFNDMDSFLNSLYNIDKGFVNFFKREIEDLDISPKEAMFISKIYYQEGISQRELAGKLYVSEANIAKTFKKLEKKELAYKSIDENNNARRKLHLTEKGEKKFEECVKIFEQFDKILFEGIDVSEKKKLLKQIKEISNRSTSSLIE